MFAVPEPQSGYFIFARAKKSTQKKHAPNGASSFCAPLPLGPSPTYSTSLCCMSGADVLSAPLTGSPQRQRCSKPRHTGTRTTKPTLHRASWVVAVQLPLEQAEHHRARGGVSRDAVRARSERFPRSASSSRARLDRGAQGTARALFASGEATGVAFSLVTFFWPHKRKSLAVGQPPTSTYSNIDNRAGRRTKMRAEKRH
jgi:hypothetical protein